MWHCNSMLNNCSVLSVLHFGFKFSLIRFVPASVERRLILMANLASRDSNVRSTLQVAFSSINEMSIFPVLIHLPSRGNKVTTFLLPTHAAVWIGMRGLMLRCSKGVTRSLLRCRLDPTEPCNVLFAFSGKADSFQLPLMQFCTYLLLKQKTSHSLFFLLLG